jgi:hypothetical protein
VRGWKEGIEKSVYTVRRHRMFAGESGSLGSVTRSRSEAMRPEVFPFGKRPEHKPWVRSDRQRTEFAPSIHQQDGEEAKRARRGIRSA